MITVRRRSVLTAGLATAALVLTACGNSGGVGGAQDAAQATAAPGETSTITYQTWYPDEETLQRAIDGFEAANPDIRVDLRVLESQDYQRQLPLQLNGGEAIDVVGVQVSAMTNTVGPQLRPVDDWADQLDAGWRERLDPQLLDQTQEIAADDTLLSIPMGGVASALVYYNNEILQQAGVAPPTTVAELADAVQQIRTAVPAVTTPVAFTGEAWWQEEMLFSFAGQNDPTLSDSLFRGDASWDQQALVEALNAYRSAFDTGAVAPDVLSLSGTDPTGLFYSGQAAFLIGGSWEASVLSASFREQNGITVSDIGVTPVPVADADGSPAVRSLAEGGLAIPRSSTHVAEAARFIAYMTYGDGVDLWNQNLAYTPVARVGWTPPPSVLTTPAATEGLARINELAAQPGSVRDSQQDFLNNVEGPAILDVLRGTTTPEQAAADLQAAWTSGRYPRGNP